MSKWRSVGIMPGGCVRRRRTRMSARAQRNHPCGRAAWPRSASHLAAVQDRHQGEKKDQWMRLPKAESCHTSIARVGGKSFDYTATAGTLIIPRRDEDKRSASIGYVAYVRHDLKGGAAALMFRVQRRTGILIAVAAHGRAGTEARRGVRSGSDAGGPYRTVDNEFGVLDKSDLVMIDPVGTA